MENINYIVSILLFIMSMSSFAYARYLAKDFFDTKTVTLCMRFSLTNDAKQMLDAMHKFFNENAHLYVLKKIRSYGTYNDKIDLTYKAYNEHDKHIDFIKLVGGHLDGKMHCFEV